LIVSFKCEASIIFTHLFPQSNLFIGLTSIQADHSE